MNSDRQTFKITENVTGVVPNYQGLQGFTFPGLGSTCGHPPQGPPPTPGDYAPWRSDLKSGTPTLTLEQLEEFVKGIRKQQPFTLEKIILDPKTRENLKNLGPPPIPNFSSDTLLQKQSSVTRLLSDSLLLTKFSRTKEGVMFDGKFISTRVVEMKLKSAMAAGIVTRTGSVDLRTAKALDWDTMKTNFTRKFKSFKSVKESIQLCLLDPIRTEYHAIQTSRIDVSSVKNPYDSLARVTMKTQSTNEVFSLEVRYEIMGATPDQLNDLFPRVRNVMEKFFDQPRRAVKATTGVTVDRIFNMRFRSS